VVSSYATDSIRVVDTDAHLTEPAGLWVDHAPAKLRDRVPRIVEDDQGRPRWVVDGKALGAIGNALVGPDGNKIMGEASATAHRYEEVHKGAYDSEARLGWMDERGIHQQVIFPNITGFGAVRLYTEVSDTELRTACVSIYNDAVAEIQRESSGRLLPMGLVPWWDMDETVNELRRVKNELGLKGITMCESPHDFGLPPLDTPTWAPFWSELEELDLAVVFHIGSGPLRHNLWSQQGGELQATNTVNSFLGNSPLVTNLIFSGVLLRHPRLKIFSAESGIGWVPFLLEALDYQWHENLLPDVKRDVWKEALPSEIFRRNFYVSFWFEQWGPAHTLDMLEDNIMFETDFPHGTSLTERSAEQVANTLAAMSPSVRQKVLHDNAARLFSLT
jgi:predicted TIM-barrel fold metal-dependent hydrolase